MCGIFGIWHHDERAVDLGAVERATSALRHRGPDDEGYLLVETRTGRTTLCGGPATPPALDLPRLSTFAGDHFDLALGFRRLAILDLSPAGHQPMPSPDRRHWLIFNGEIYNYLELRAELQALGHPFRTGSDTEVILAAYAAWGPACLNRFNGMWAFALWQGARRDLFLARDRFGVKPLYTATAPDGTFAFASEIKALAAAGVVAFQPDPLAVAAYVAQGRYPSAQAGATFWTGVRALPAAHYARVSSPAWTAQRYWGLPTTAGPPTPQSAAGSTYRDLFDDAVRLRLRADVAVGTCLSGGLDSSSIVAVAGELMQREHAVSLERLGDHQQTFSAVYDEAGRWDERTHIAPVLARTGAAGNSIVPTAERLWTDLDRLIWHQDEPFAGTSIFAQWCVMSLARERGVTVLLDGQGADEVLGGYRPFGPLLGELLRGGHPGRALAAVRAIGAVTGLPQLPLLARALVGQAPAPALLRLRQHRVRGYVAEAGLRPDLAAALLAAEAADAAPYVAGRTLHRHLARLVVEDSLPTLLRYEDRNSMAFAREARVPFLDYRLVEYAFTAAAPWRVHAGWTKWIQRQTVADRLPDSVVWRRDKVGFETPELAWLRAGQDHLLDLLAPDSQVAAYLDLPAARAAVPRLLAAGQTGLVWRWANLAGWLRAFGGA
ncbi:MAG: asparagine synthase (glutamine-hydrolyzing) [Chloroflexota bacterium]|nr:asparagine synthase (glutamine-hydrolyzing) [Chloroflexota bacterium]